MGRYAGRGDSERAGVPRSEAAGWSGQGGQSLGRVCQCSGALLNSAEETHRAMLCTLCVHGAESKKALHRSAQGTPPSRLSWPSR